METLLEELLALPHDERTALIDDLTDDEALALLYDWDFWARDKQRSPEGNWYIWLIKSGRGFGKTRTGAEWIRAQQGAGFGRFALIAETKADARDVMVEGESGIIAISPPWNTPKYEPSKRRLTWENGAIATTYSGDEPGQLRGPQHDKGWIDEIAKFMYPVETLDNFEFGLRLGVNPQGIITSTPRNIKVIQELIKDPRVHVTSGSLYENIANLPQVFVDRIRAKYEGTRLGRQEIHGEVLDDNPNALWRREDIESGRVTSHPDLFRVVVAVDPSGNKGKEAEGDGANEVGIVTAGAAGPTADERHLFVLGDSLGHLNPLEWAKQAVADFYRFQADCIVAESNYGGELVRTVIRTVDSKVPVRLVHASRGKAVRAEPVAGLYEQGRGHHVGMFATLEDELCDWEPGASDSPNRLDALVWAGTALIFAPPDDKPKPKKQTYHGF